MENTVADALYMGYLSPCKRPAKPPKLSGQNRISNTAVSNPCSAGFSEIYTNTNLSLKICLNNGQRKMPTRQSYARLLVCLRVGAIVSECMKKGWGGPGGKGLELNRRLKSFSN